MLGIQSGGGFGYPGGFDYQSSPPGGGSFNDSPHTTSQREMARFSNEQKAVPVQTVRMIEEQQPEIESVLREKGRTLNVMG